MPLDMKKDGIGAAASSIFCHLFFIMALERPFTKAVQFEGEWSLPNPLVAALYIVIGVCASRYEEGGRI